MDIKNLNGLEFNAVISGLPCERVSHERLSQNQILILNGSSDMYTFVTVALGSDFSNSGHRLLGLGYLSAPVRQLKYWKRSHRGWCRGTEAGT